ncbi:hypothetical protein SpiGrapes_2717 [Sphaerochaeta pleomorpha str. Grapes]|uniref:Uncharacterized protein n=1 Tax=Sphaerochaeta pleomorpha (strain ATCC BAA-1885 / DSM 22778 / Grapes) TaxID=158190 RepID=G8QVV0_SPHPG|nr:hypothetical protein [Sphaerochaeta pleomorpha]AEV30474.1 hypothetical protein SpiGrapes_2717 [Sphaerochaeta pleomorpha str. Grapes]
MKKGISSILQVAVSCLLLVSLFFGCSDIPSSQALIVVNASENVVSLVSIRQTNISPKKMENSTNALIETIAPGESMTFYLGTSLVDSIRLYISDAEGYASIDFTYEFHMHGGYEDIIASYTGTGITLSGGHAEEIVQDYS